MPDNQTECRERVVRAARAALEEAAGGGAAVPQKLAAAIADGRGDRKAVDEATRRIFGERRPLDLVLFDTDRIAEYVYESSLPPVIAGASKILRELNADIKQRYEKQTIFSGGGEGLLLVERGKGEGICQEIRNLYWTRTDGALGVTTNFLEVSPQDFISLAERDEARDGVRLVTGTQAVLARLRDQVRRRKDEDLPPLIPVQGSLPRCISCRDRAANRPAPVPREGLSGNVLCSPCFLRWSKGKDEIAGVSFDELIETLLKEYPDLGAKSRYTGFLYADGNSMGALFGRLSSLAEIGFLSHAVSEVFDQLEERAATEVDTRLGAIKVRNQRLFLSYLGGGDEAIWIVPGALAVHLAQKLPGWLSEEVRKVPGLAALLRREGFADLTLGSGLVLCSHSYPVRYQYALAKELQKKAKEMFYGSAQQMPPSSIDFELLTDSSPLVDDLKAARRLAYRTEEKGFFRTCRPFDQERFDQLLDRMRKAREKNVATSQLHHLLSGAEEGRRIFLNYLRYQIARPPAGKSYQEWLSSLGTAWIDAARVESFFVHELPPDEHGPQAGTWIADGLQLLPFLNQLGRLGKEAR